MDETEIYNILDGQLKDKLTYLIKEQDYQGSSNMCLKYIDDYLEEVKAAIAATWKEHELTAKSKGRIDAYQRLQLWIGEQDPDKTLAGLAIQVKDALNQEFASLQSAAGEGGTP